MKQIIQSFKTGETQLLEVPSPKVQKGAVLIRTTESLVSLGTERMLVTFGKSNLISKAKQQPDKVKQVINKIKSEGLITTLNSVSNKLEQPLPLGYCNVGEIIEVGSGVEGLKIGDRVASNGPHAEIVCVPQNLVSRIPDDVTNHEATFTVIGSIGLQGIRLLKPSYGETIVVYGLGLIGLLTAQLLMANGATVIGIDIDDTKLNLAEKWGVSCFNSRRADSVEFVNEETNGIGADGVIITASNKSEDIISQVAQMTRKRGRVILVGDINLNLSRADFYKKELKFQVSCSYGPGRYDRNYEEGGQDYPLEYVRWTEKRNFDAVLMALKNKKLIVNDMISEVVDINDYQKIYDGIERSKSVASILSYSKTDLSTRQECSLKLNSFESEHGTIGIIGSGNFTKMTLLPNIIKSKPSIKYIASLGGVTGTALAKKYGIANSTTDYKLILEDESVSLVIISTRHDSHAELILECLNSGKDVFVEKPLAIKLSELDEIVELHKARDQVVTVGFNRRFSPHSIKIKEIIGDSQISVIANMNAGSIPKDSWVHDMDIGGGRIIGEACHMIDLISFLTGSKVESVCMQALGENPKNNTDNANILLKYKNGSIGVINYFSNGSKSYSKERVEVYFREKTIVMDNFIETKGYGINGFNRLKTKIDKGHYNQFTLLNDRVRSGGPALIPFDEVVNTTKTSLLAIQSLVDGTWQKVE